MELEKLIEQLNGYFEGKELKRGAALEAATALAALQADAEGMRSNWYKSVETIKQLRAELEQVKRERDAAMKFITPACYTCKKDEERYLPDGKLSDHCYTCRRNERCNWEWRGP